MKSTALFSVFVLALSITSSFAQESDSGEGPGNLVKWEKIRIELDLKQKMPYWHFRTRGCPTKKDLIKEAKRRVERICSQDDQVANIKSVYLDYVGDVRESYPNCSREGVVEVRYICKDEE